MTLHLADGSRQMAEDDAPLSNGRVESEHPWYTKATTGATIVSMFAAAAGGVVASGLAPGIIDVVEAGSAVVGAGVGWYVGARERGKP